MSMPAVLPNVRLSGVRLSGVQLTAALALFGLFACTGQRPDFGNTNDSTVNASNALQPDASDFAGEAGVSPASSPDADVSSADPLSTDSIRSETPDSGSAPTASTWPDGGAKPSGSRDTREARDASNNDTRSSHTTGVDKSDAGSVNTTSETEACRTDDGFRRCGDDCIPATDCCDDSECPSEGICDDGSCICPANTHVCDDACVSNDAVTSCGVSCSACPAPSGGTATCDGTNCGGVCPQGSKLCLGECIDVDLECNGECPSNTRNCGDFCTALDSVGACGPECETCPTPSNATPKCVDDACDFDCTNGYKRCNGACIPQDSCCTSADCAGELTCNSNTCGCGAQKRCGDECVPTSGCCSGECSGDLECVAEACACPSGQKSCGGNRCAPTNGCCSSSECPGDLTCDDGSCACPSGEKSCGGSQCVPDSGCCDDDDCTGDLECSSSVCACPAGEKSCGGAACAPSSGCCDDDECDTGQSCTNGQCVDDVPPQVVSVTPNNATTGVVFNQPFTVVFSERMNTASSSAVSVQPSAGLTLTWDNTGTRLTIAATNGWDYGTETAITYTITIGTSATDTTGNILTPAVTSTFSTLRTASATLNASTAAYWNLNTASPTICTSGNLQVGQQSSAPAGEYRSYIEFDMGSLNAHSIVSALFSISQTTTGSNASFYDSSWVVLGQLAAGPIDASLASRPSTSVHASTFVSSSSETTPSLDVSQYVKERWTANERSKHVFSINYGSTPPNNVYATFACNSPKLEVTYLTP